MIEVDFFTWAPFHVGHFGPIVTALKERGIDARFVCEPPSVNPRVQHIMNGVSGYGVDEHALETVVDLVAERGDTPIFKGRYATASAVITTNGINYVDSYEGAKIRAAYGVATSAGSMNWKSWNAGFDTILQHGEWSRQNLEGVFPPEGIFLTGFPKYAPYFREGIEKNHWRKEWRLDPDKPVLAYLPTWGKNSSLERYVPAILALSKEYNVIYKPHGMTLRFERHRYELLRRAPGVIVDEATPTLVPFLAMADVVVADCLSGAFPESFLVDRPTIGLSAHGDPTEDNQMDGIEEAAPICMNPEELPTLVAAAIQNDVRAEGRRRLARYFFKDCGARDDEVAADAILEIIERKQLRSHRHDAIQGPLKPHISVIVFADEKPSLVLQCLDALRRQEIPPNEFEVLVIEPTPGRGLADMLHEQHYPFRLKHINVGHTMMEALRAASFHSGAHISLLLSGSDCPDSDLLKRHIYAHAAIQASIAMLGPIHSISPSPQDALTQIDIENSIFEVAEEVSTRQLQWWQFRPRNVSLKTLDLQAAVRGLPSQSKVDSGIGYSLEQEGCKILFDSSLSCGTNGVKNVHELREEFISAGRNLTYLACRWPSVVDHPALHQFRDTPLTQIEELVESNVWNASEWIHAVEELSAIHPERLNLFGPDAAHAARVSSQILETALEGLRDYWTKEGVLTALRDLSTISLQQIASLASSAFRTNARDRYLAWPDYADESDMRVLGLYMEVLAGQDRSCLFLMHDPTIDPPQESILDQLESTYSRAVSTQADLNVQIIDRPLDVGGMKRISLAMNALLTLPSGRNGERAVVESQFNGLRIASAHTLNCGH